MTIHENDQILYQIKDVNGGIYSFLQCQFWSDVGKQMPLNDWNSAAH